MERRGRTKITPLLRRAATHEVVRPAEPALKIATPVPGGDFSFPKTDAILKTNPRPFGTRAGF
jgi:hypothetical protein